MSKLKARLFDAVKRSASGGITSRYLTEIVYSEGASQVLIRNHIAQINDKLAGTDWRIRGTRGSHSVYRLVRERAQ